jgi:aromatic-L-amino-acid/L-tryptophan decarboxylase
VSSKTAVFTGLLQKLEVLRDRLPRRGELMLRREACLLVRDTEKLRRAFAFSAPYILAERDPLMLDFLDYGPQLSRSFKAFKVWCALRTFGVSAFRSAIDNALELAAYLSDRIEAERTLELMTPTTLTAVCFSVRNAGLAAHRSIVRTLQGEGTAFLGPAELDGAPASAHA